jgi:hypothetical protein
MPKKRTPARRKAAGNPGEQIGSFSRWPGITGRIARLVRGRESVLTWAGEPLMTDYRKLPEPKDKLGASW